MEHASRSNDAASPFEQASGGRQLAVAVGNGVAVALLAPLALLVRVEHWRSPQAEGFFLFFAQLLAGAPGLPGMIFRRAYYWWTLERCSLRLMMGYGAYFSHRMCRVADHVYIGPYAVIGAADIGQWALIGTRVSLISGGELHSLDASGRWLPTDLKRIALVRVGAHAWVGEGAILMADVGRGAMVAAGAVVSAPVADGVMVAGNPARFVRHLTPAVTSEAR